MDKIDNFKKVLKKLLGDNYDVTTFYNLDTGKIEVIIFKRTRDDGLTLEVNEWNLTNPKIMEQIAGIVQEYYMRVRKV